MWELDLLATADYTSSWVIRKKRDKENTRGETPECHQTSQAPALLKAMGIWEFVLVLICQYQRSLRRHGTATKIPCHCQSFAWQALQANRYIFLVPRLSFAWGRFGRPRLLSPIRGPSALLLPTSLLQLSLAANPKQELQVKIHPAWQFRETMETMQGSW